MRVFSGLMCISPCCSVSGLQHCGPGRTGGPHRDHWGDSGQRLHHGIWNSAPGRSVCHRNTHFSSTHCLHRSRQSSRKVRSRTGPGYYVISAVNGLKSEQSWNSIIWNMLFFLINLGLYFRSVLRHCYVLCLILTTLHLSLIVIASQTRRAVSASASYLPPFDFSHHVIIAISLDPLLGSCDKGTCSQNVGWLNA